MGVSLRKKVNSSNQTSLYLDIYHNGKRTYEFLPNLKLITKPVTVQEREQNKSNLNLARQILAKRQHELASTDYNIIPSYKQKIDFFSLYDAFVTSYTKADKRVVKGSYDKFVEFCKESEIKSLNTTQVDAHLCNDFKIYLEDKLTGESPANYFKKFKMMLRYAVRRKVFLSSPAQEISVSIKGRDRIKKHILSAEEIQVLSSTPISNAEVKRAFIFSLFTGLRFSDVQNLQWHNIELKSGVMNITQQKTGEQVTMNLHKTALQMLGSKAGKKTDLVFKNLPSHQGTTKLLKGWVAAAGISKKITWHCARHSFATNLIYYGADVNTASKLLGHTGLKYTERYTHIVKSLKEKAITNLPEII